MASEKIFQKAVDGSVKEYSLTLGARIGEGSQGSVYVGSLSDGSVSHPLIVKSMIKPLQSKNNYLHSEVSTILKASSKTAVECHPNVNCFYGVVFPGDFDETPFNLSSGSRAGVNASGASLVFYKPDLAPNHRYLLYEYVDGISLDKLCPMSDPRQLANTFADILRGLAHLHSHKIAHHDFKAENIMVGKDGVTKIIDFGFSCFASKCSPKSGFTPATMAPELRLFVKAFTAYASGQFEQKIFNALKLILVDQLEADIFSAGVTLYRMITGHDLFSNDEPYTIPDYANIFARIVLPAPFAHLTGFLQSLLSINYEALNAGLAIVTIDLKKYDRSTIDPRRAELRAALEESQAELAAAQAALAAFEAPLGAKVANYMRFRDGKEAEQARLKALLDVEQAKPFSAERVAAVDALRAHLLEKAGEKYSNTSVNSSRYEELLSLVRLATLSVESNTEQLEEFEREFGDALVAKKRAELTAASQYLNRQVAALKAKMPTTIGAGRPKANDALEQWMALFPGIIGPAAAATGGASAATGTVVAEALASAAHGAGASGGSRRRRNRRRRTFKNRGRK